MSSDTLDFVPVARMLHDVDQLNVKEISRVHMNIFLSQLNTPTLMEIVDSIEALNTIGYQAVLCAVFEDSSGCMPTFEIGVQSDEA